MPNYIDILKLENHIEGGYFGVFYKSSNKVKLFSKHVHNIESGEERKYIERYACSSIYFLLEKQAFSAWHRLKSDEIWHYYDGGSPIDIHTIDNDGDLKTYSLDNPGETEDSSFQVILKAGMWFAAEVRNKSSFGLIGCTVSPAFEYSDFELAEPYRNQLVAQHPKLESMIDKFIKPNAIKSCNQSSNYPVLSPKKNRLSAKDYIKKLNLGKHKEGGYFRIHYNATDVVLSNDETAHSAGTAIYFLLEKQDFSAWHRLKSDEIWHFYDGESPIDIHTIDQEGNLKTQTLANPLLIKNASFQIVIKSGDWFAAELRDKSSFSLVGRTVSPGLEYDDFTLADRKDLISQYPQHDLIINRLTRATLFQTKSQAIKTFSYAAIALISSIGIYSFFKKN
ncbi:MAG: hypothetical protein A3F11_08240, partial [Gammaproteobacteria bacterium RIFCSPHIGHO2_12_FULL_37_14]